MMPRSRESTMAAMGQGAPPWGAIVDGAWVTPSDLDTFVVAEPATGRPLADVVSGDASLVDQAVSAARGALPSWRALAPRERAAILRDVAAVIRDHVEELATVLTRENGKPRRDALLNDLVFSHSAFDYYAGLAPTLHGEIIDQGPIETRVVLEPYGVVAAVLPFNWPPIHFAKKCAPALAAGNTVIIKPGEQAPLTILRLTELANQVLPPGVLNAVPGLAAGPALVSHPGVDRISFTGASQTGRRVLELAAEQLTFATMELGGKNALIVMPDAEVEQAVEIAVEAMFYNQGEACTSTSRLVVHEAVYGQFRELFGRAVAQLRVGDGLDPNTDVGPMVDARQRDRVLGFLAQALDEGAEIVAQGSVPSQEEYEGGYWVPPTLLEGVSPESTIAQEEVFGPIALLLPFATTQEAIAIANGTKYGLTAAIMSRDEAQAWRIAQELEAGMVFVNNYMRRSFLGAPFGGMKDSGFGRENANETLREFVRAKAVRFRSGRGAVPTWPPARE